MEEYLKQNFLSYEFTTIVSSLSWIKKKLGKKVYQSWPEKEMERSQLGPRFLQTIQGCQIVMNGFIVF